MAIRKLLSSLFGYASLSLACALTGRKLIVCDSFRGLPKPTEDKVYDIRADFQDYLLWEEGEFGSEGGVAGVKSNVAKFGSIEACRFYCDEEWWETNLNSTSPGFFGSGKEIMTGLHDSSIGYAEKFDLVNRRDSGHKMMHAGSRGFDGTQHG